MAQKNAYHVRDEYGTLVAGSLQSSYDLTCRLAWALRQIGSCDFMVVDTGLNRAISEVVEYNEDLDNFAIAQARKLWKDHKRKLYV